MSALPPKADIRQRGLDVRFGPKATRALQQSGRLFDGFSGGGGHFKARHPF